MAKVVRSAGTDRDAKVKRMRRDIRAAQLRVVLDKECGRITPPAVVRLSQLPLPKFTVTGDPAPSPADRQNAAG